MLKIVGLAGALAMSLSGVSWAGFQSWSVDKNSDPFSGGDSVTINFMDSLRSGVVIFCDSSKQGLTIRSIPGFAYESQLEGYAPTLKFAIDSKVLFDVEGAVGSVGDNMAVSEAELSSDQAKQFTDAFVAAKKQVAIQDGIADKPQLLTARGSKISGLAIKDCIAKQAAK